VGQQLERSGVRMVPEKIQPAAVGPIVGKDREGDSTARKPWQNEKSMVTHRRMAGKVPQGVIGVANNRYWIRTFRTIPQIIEPRLPVASRFGSIQKSPERSPHGLSTNKHRQAKIQHLVVLVMSTMSCLGRLHHRPHVQTPVMRQSFAEREAEATTHRQARQKSRKGADRAPARTAPREGMRWGKGDANQRSFTASGTLASSSRRTTFMGSQLLVPLARRIHGHRPP